MKTSILFILTLAFLNLAHATPSEVILIRHGEKPPDGDSLNERGFQRANALVGFFENNPAVLRFGTPIAIYAQSAKHGNKDGSLRPIQTVQPLALSLGLPLDTTYTRPEIQAMAQEILNNPVYDGRMVLICWEHNMIPPLAQALGAQNAPTNWPGSAFDRAWILDYENGQVSHFTNLPQNLLPGDSPR